MRLAFTVKDPVKREWKSISTLFTFAHCENAKKKGKERSISKKKDAKIFKRRKIVNMPKNGAFLQKYFVKYHFKKSKSQRGKVLINAGECDIKKQRRTQLREIKGKRGEAV